MKPVIPVSCGELVDKVTILEIKARRIRNASKRKNVLRELTALRQVERQIPRFPDVAQLKSELRRVNGELWRVEDALRAREAARTFDARFVLLARSVYVLNDRRASFKRQINLLTGSDLVEEKQHPTK